MSPVFTASSFSPEPTLYNEILDEMEDGVYLVDRTERIQWWNRGAEAITGFSRAEVVGRTCADNLLCLVDSSGRFLCTNGCPLRRAFLTGVPIETRAFLHHKEGHRVPVNIKTKPLRDRQGHVFGAFEVFRRASEEESQARLIKELSQLALIDELTRLPNRQLLDAHLERRLAELDRFGWKFGLLIIDIDHFKLFNDSSCSTTTSATNWETTSFAWFRAHSSPTAGHLTRSRDLEVMNSLPSSPTSKETRCGA
jgi:PAS domain S-box-containing protein